MASRKPISNWAANFLGSLTRRPTRMLTTPIAGGLSLETWRWGLSAESVDGPSVDFSFGSNAAPVTGGLKGLHAETLLTFEMLHALEPLVVKTSPVTPPTPSPPP